MDYILFIIGFFILIKGADLLVEGASAFGKKIGMSQLLIGLTIVAFGTSAPELVVNLVSAVSGNTDLALGNILGSNIANVLLILGISAIVFPITVGKATAFKEVPFNILAAVAILVLAGDHILDGAMTSFISRGDAVILILFFAIFLFYTVQVALSEKNNEDTAGEKEAPLSTIKSIGYVIIGLAGLTFGGQWIVNGSILIAESLGMSQTLIGLTIVAVGTSLPELATSVVAALKKKTDIVIGNIVGSNIFNTFWILGVTALVKPIPFNHNDTLNLYANVFVSLILFMMLFIGKRHTIQRSQGVLFVLLYILFIGYSVMRSIA